MLNSPLSSWSIDPYNSLEPAPLPAFSSGECRRRSFDFFQVGRCRLLYRCSRLMSLLFLPHRSQQRYHPRHRRELAGPRAAKSWRPPPSTPDVVSVRIAAASRARAPPRRSTHFRHAMGQCIPVHRQAAAGFGLVDISLFPFSD
jgi:hypothetical protein